MATTQRQQKSAFVTVGGGEAKRLPPSGCARDKVRSNCDVCIRISDCEVMPSGSDIVGIRCTRSRGGRNDGLLGMSLRIGGQRVLYWDAAALESGDELLGKVMCDAPFVLPTSLAYYMITDLAFHYDPGFIEARASWSKGSLWEEVDDYGCGGMHEFRDAITGVIRMGTRVRKREEKIQVVKSGFPVTVPEIAISYAPTRTSMTDGSALALVRFWQRFEGEPTDYMRTTWGVRESEDGKERHVRNAIRFMGGTAGVCLCLS